MIVVWVSPATNCVVPGTKTAIMNAALRMRDKFEASEARHHTVNVCGRLTRRRVLTPTAELSTPSPGVGRHATSGWCAAASGWCEQRHRGCSVTGQ